MTKRSKNRINGWLILDKPLGLTSTQALGKVKRILNPAKAGHAGTLDPLADGVLPIALGEATKTILFAQDALKTYRFTVGWGRQTSTDDAEGEIVAQSDNRPDRAAIEAALAAYIGEIDQLPPTYSALKVDGQRAYDLARGGEAVDLKPRPVYIESLEIAEGGHDAAAGETTFTCVCGKGTYVRSLARDLGRDLGCYGTVTALTRLAVGAMTLENAISLDKLAEMADNGAAEQAVSPLRTVLDDIPALPLLGDEAARLKNGQAVDMISPHAQNRLMAAGAMEVPEAQTILALDGQGKEFGLLDLDAATLRVARLFNL